MIPLSPRPIVILDASSDQTWIQCSKCDPCFNLTNTNHVEDSSSYFRLPQDDRRCTRRMSYGESCGFEASFGTGQTEGYMGTNILYPNGLGGGYYPNFAFGCGVKNIGFAFGVDPKNVIVGVFGLGIGPRSFMDQLDWATKGRFTYCICPNSRVSNLIFGDDAQISKDDPNFQSINMLSKSHYHLYLADITVEKNRLPINSSIFEIEHKDYTTGFFIDPASPFTVLTFTAYKQLRDAIVKHFKGDNYKWEPLQLVGNIFDLCYPNAPNKSKGQVYPSVTFHFIKLHGATGHDTREVDLKFDSKNIFGKFNKGFCMLILPTPDSKDGPSIIGAYQQANIQFVFDVENSVLSFVPKTC